MNSQLSALCCLLLAFQTNTAPAPSSVPVQRQTAAGPSPALIEGCKQPCLEDGTPIKLRLAQTVSSANAHLNDQVQFEVLEDIKISDVLVINKGGIAWGTVTEAQPKRRMARGGKLDIAMDSVRLVDGEKAALRATAGGQGGGHVGAMTAGIVATGLLFFPAAPFFLFMHGKDITIPKGTEVPTFVNGNFQLDLARFQPAPAEAAEPPRAPSAPASSDLGAQISVSSSPAGADIELDGTFVGSTPSVIGVTAGDHTIQVAKNGFKAWQRQVKVTTGQIAISADLEPAP